MYNYVVDSLGNYVLLVLLVYFVYTDHRGRKMPMRMLVILESYQN
jgi:hypothetical protein